MNTDWQEVDCGWFEKTNCEYNIGYNACDYYPDEDKEETYSVVDQNNFFICDVPTFEEAVEVVEYLEDMKKKLKINS